MNERSLDKDLKKITRLQNTTVELRRSVLPLAFGAVFLILVGGYTTFIFGGFPSNEIVILAAVIGGYMALNIGANDVANTMGPAVASGTLTLAGALIIAAVFNVAGAFIAGGNVISTISKGIIDPSLINEQTIFIFAMLAALSAAAIWINVATVLNAPVSTTHAIVGGVMGAGIAAAGFAVVNWGTMGKIAASWVISPVMGGMIAAILYQSVRLTIYNKENRVEAAIRTVPILVAIMAAAFSAFLLMKGFKRIWNPSGLTISAISGTFLLVTPFLIRPFVVRAAQGLGNRRKEIATLFRYPLIFGTALLAFAHGANDVANAIGPLAAIVSISGGGEVASKVAVPGWIIGIGGLGIAYGLSVYGPRLIEVVGEKLTRMDQVRAFCVALAAAITVIAASLLGLPISSTHTAVGAIFGIGLFREALANRPVRFTADGPLKKREKKRLLVRRQQLFTIVAAWLVTVPSAALLSAGLFWLMILVS